MVLLNNKLLIILSTALCCLMLSPLYAENRYIFPDEVIHGQAKHNQYNTQYNTGFSAQQRYWTYPQYISDFDKKKQAVQYAPSSSVRHNIRYPGTDKKYVNNRLNTTTGNLLYPGDLVSKKKNVIKPDKYRDYKTPPSYPEVPDNNKHSERYLSPKYDHKYSPKYESKPEPQHDRYNDEHYKKDNEKYTGTQYIVGYKYIPVPIYSVQKTLAGRDNLPEMISDDSSYNTYYNDRNNNLRPSQYYSPEKYGVFSTESSPFNLSTQQHDNLLNLDHLFPQLGSINSDL